MQIQMYKHLHVSILYIYKYFYSKHSYHLLNALCILDLLIVASLTLDLSLST